MTMVAGLHECYARILSFPDVGKSFLLNATSSLASADIASDVRRWPSPLLQLCNLKFSSLTWQATVAGSDTTSTTLSSLFYFFFLLKNPWDYKRLQTEIDAALPPGEGDPFDTAKLAELPFQCRYVRSLLQLNAKDLGLEKVTIDEEMRPTSSTLQRAPEAESGGKWIGDRFISEGTSVIVPPYTVHRQPAYFSPSPDTFWPDRWLYRGSVEQDSQFPSAGHDIPVIKEGSEVITNATAFIPFSYGPANCAGHSLALMELHMIVALMVQRFEFHFSAHYDPDHWEEHLEDFFLMFNGTLRVSVTPRT